MTKCKCGHREISVPADTLNAIYERTGGAFGPVPDAYGQAVEAEYQRLNAHDCKGYQPAEETVEGTSSRI